MRKVRANDGGCLGCVGLIACVLFLWALCFGVTINGRHYGLFACDARGGLIIDNGEAR